MPSFRYLFYISLCALVPGPTIVLAELVTYSTASSQFTPGTSNQGWWANNTASVDTNDNYIAAQFGATVHRPFFTFDLADRTESALVATLFIQRESSSASNELMETIEFFDVETSAAALNNNSGINTAIFADLGSGQSYGSFTIDGSGPSGDILAFELNSVALADINSSLGGFFSVGGVLDSAETGDYLFGFSGGFDVELVISSIPEPSGLTLALTGALIVLPQRRRRSPLTDVECQS